MDLEKYTDRAKGFVQAAQSVALREGHQQFGPDHLLKVLLDDPEGMAAGLIERAGGRSADALAAVEQVLAKRPKVSGGGAGQIYLAPDLARDHHVLALDQRGHGDSDWAPRYDRAAFSGDIAAVLDAHGWDAATLVALSLGGLNAIAFAASHPERVCGLVEDARRHGAAIHAGGDRLGRKGYFFAPTIVTASVLGLPWLHLGSGAGTKVLALGALRAWSFLMFNMIVCDLRDRAGDAACGIRSLPVVLGDRGTHWLLAVLLVAIEGRALGAGAASSSAHHAAWQMLCVLGPTYLGGILFAVRRPCSERFYEWVVEGMLFLPAVAISFAG